MKLHYVGPRPNLRLIDQILMRQPCTAIRSQLLVEEELAKIVGPFAPPIKSESTQTAGNDVFLDEKILFENIKSNPGNVPALLKRIKTCADSGRQALLAYCSKNNQSLLNSRIAAAFKNSTENEKYLYLLELERIILDEPVDSEVRHRLGKLFLKLKKLDPTAIDEWNKAVQEAQKEPVLLDIRAMFAWFRSALGFAHPPAPKGYGIGIRKPTVDDLLDSMAKLPFNKR